MRPNKGIDGRLKLVGREGGRTGILKSEWEV